MLQAPQLPEAAMTLVVVTTSHTASTLPPVVDQGMEEGMMMSPPQDMGVGPSMARSMGLAKDDVPNLDMVQGMDLAKDVVPNLDIVQSMDLVKDVAPNLDMVRSMGLGTLGGMSRMSMDRCMAGGGGPRAMNMGVSIKLLDIQIILLEGMMMIIRGMVKTMMMMIIIGELRMAGEMITMMIVIKNLGMEGEIMMMTTMIRSIGMVGETMTMMMIMIGIQDMVGTMMMTTVMLIVVAKNMEMMRMPRGRISINVADTMMNKHQRFMVPVLNGVWLCSYLTLNNEFLGIFQCQYSILDLMHRFKTIYGFVWDV